MSPNLSTYQKGVQAVAKCLDIGEILVKIDFRKQQTEVLEVFPRDRFASLLVYLVGKLHDVLVVEVESFHGEHARSIELITQLMIELRLAVLVHPFQPCIASELICCVLVFTCYELSL